MNKIIVIGSGNHHNTLGVIRALGMRGFSVEAILTEGKRGGYVSRSKYITSIETIVSFSELENVLLKRERPTDGSKEIIISCADEATEMLNESLDLLSVRYIVPGVPQQGRMVKLMDKLEMKRMGEDVGFCFPYVYDEDRDSDDIEYPVITKANVSSHGGKSDIIICHTAQELNNYLARTEGDVFVQQFVKKKEEVQFIGCSIDGGREVVIPGMTQILRSQHNTNTGFLRYGPVDPFYIETVNQCKDFLKRCEYSGLFSMEFLRGEDDKVYFLEINYRNDGNAWCVTASGINLPVIWVKACMGEIYSDELHTAAQITVMPEFQDFKLVIQRKVGLVQWLRDLRRTDSLLDWNKEDKKPFFWFILNKII